MQTGVDINRIKLPTQFDINDDKWMTDMMKISDWNKLRAKLHHDWLQNRYLTFLMARAEYMDGIIDGRASVSEDILEQFTGWKDKTEDMHKLINEAVYALSPAQLLDEYPLNRMAEENKKWLKEVVHSLYVERTGMKETSEKLTEKFSIVSELYAFLLRILKGENNGLRQKAGEPPFKRFYNEVQEFSKVISSLPHEVQVV